MHEAPNNSCYTHAILLSKMSWDGEVEYTTDSPLWCMSFNKPQVVLSRDYVNGIVFRGNPQGRKLILLDHAEHHFHAITTYVYLHCLKEYAVPGEHKYFI